MMRGKSTQQLLEVLEHFYEHFIQGKPLSKSYQSAVTKVASSHGLTYQTIGDGCRRRLNLENITEFYDLLKSWVEGDGGPLMAQLKRNTEPHSHNKIKDFFESVRFSEGKESNRSSPVDSSGSEAITFRLSGDDARKLRALAEISGVSVSMLVARLTSEAIREKLQKLAHEIGG